MICTKAYKFIGVSLRSVCIVTHSIQNATAVTVADAQAVVPKSSQTWTFIDRQQASDLRVVSYNILWITIFPDNNPSQADKFERILNALEPDVLNLQEIGDRFCGSCTPKTAEDVRILLNHLAPLSSGGS